MNELRPTEKSRLAVLWLELRNIKLFMRSEAMQLYVGEILFSVLLLGLALILLALFER